MKSEVYNQSTSIVLKVADLFYTQKKTQKEIAQLLNISSPTVSRLLKRAEKEGIVAHVIQCPYCDCLDLEKELKTKYGLTEVIVSPPIPGETDEEEIKKQVALEGARFVQRVLTPEDMLGIAWGGTMYYLIQYLNPCQKTEASFVTLHGSLSCCDYELDVRTLVARMAMAFGGKQYPLVSEGLMSSSGQIQMLRKEERVERIFEMFNRVTISVSGI